jgi:hypothetical protein
MKHEKVQRMNIRLLLLAAFLLMVSRSPGVMATEWYLGGAVCVELAKQGNADLLVQRITDRYGHTAPFQADEVFGAFEELVEWVDTGIAPTP